MNAELEPARTIQESEGQSTVWANFEPQLPDNSEWWLVDEDGTSLASGAVQDDQKGHLAVGIPSSAQGGVSLHIRSADFQIDPNSVVESAGGLIIIDNLEIHEVMTRSLNTKSTLPSEKTVG